MTSDREIARRSLACLDLTNLDDRCTRDDVVRLCERASTPFGHVAAVCVWPRFVATAAECLAGLEVGIATVVNFPSGDEPLGDVIDMTRASLADGATEIDLVLPYSSFVRGDTARASECVSTVRGAVPASRHLKVILETGEIGDVALIESAARLAIAAGADFLKTSTGKTKTSATPDAVRAMLGVIRSTAAPVGIKPSGGIRTIDDARVYLDLADEIMGPTWATPHSFRFGASGLLDAVLATLGVT
ncbi:MAG: deoxyribose-phosphate aldolase [Actinomycetota bacterium]